MRGAQRHEMATRVVWRLLTATASDSPHSRRPATGRRHNRAACTGALGVEGHRAARNHGTSDEPDVVA